MRDAKKMMCPDCGVEMNHHAMKIDYTAEPNAHEAVDAELGGVLMEAHSCPQCGQTAMRKANNGVADDL
jgi:ribosomal protein S27AE